MNSATFKFKVEGSDYQNLQDKVKKELAGFIEIDLEDLSRIVLGLQKNDRSVKILL
jgi:hypothetical protein